MGELVGDPLLLQVLQMSPEQIVENFRPELFSIRNFELPDPEFHELKMNSFLSGAPMIQRDVVGHGSAGAGGGGAPPPPPPPPAPGTSGTQPSLHPLR